MVTEFLNLCLQIVVSSVGLYWLFMPVIVMGIFALVVRLFLRRYY